ncbi:MAG: phosphoribosylamine--glycine ligase [Actinomycetota bacterium]
MGARVLVVGGGGREHALVAALVADPVVGAVVAAPGNPGIAALARCAPVRVDDVDGLVALAVAERVDLVVVGPEAPLVAGLVDALAARDVPAFGPSAEAARLEGSKAYAKAVMDAAGVPTAPWTTTSDPAEALAALDRSGPPWVVKADGLAAGKGVVVTEDRAEAERAVADALVARRFGDAGATVVVEGFLAGPERSLFAVCDGEDAVLLAPAQDHKRIGDGDTGPNTGGMGAFSPVPGFALGDARVDALRDTHVLPVLRELAGRGTPFRGLLYVGLVDTADGPQVLEFNVRLGDPEAQVVLPRLASSPYALLHAAAVGAPARGDGVASVPVAFDAGAAVTVVLASGGYPESSTAGVPIEGVDAAAATGAHVFHAGTALDDSGRLVTAGGRVLAVTGTGDDVAAARAAAYGAADLIRFDGLQRRGDIAASAG